MTALHTDTRQPGQMSSWQVFLVLGVAIAVIALAGLLGYQHGATQAREQRITLLNTIADLKEKQVSNWLTERRGDAELVLRDEPLARLVDEWIAYGTLDNATGRAIRLHMQSILLASQYFSVLLLDRALVTRAVVGVDIPMNEAIRRSAQQALTEGATTHVDYSPDSESTSSGDIFTLFAPLRIASESGSRIVGLLALSIDAEQTLVPLLDWWPMPETSGETYLLNKQDSELLFLSRPRQAKSQTQALTAARLDREISAATPAGQARVFDSIDYRNQAVLAIYRAIPDTDWTLVAKVDRAEIARAAEAMSQRFILLSAAFLALVGSLAGYWWNRQHTRYRLARVQSDQERQILVQHLDYLSKYANDVILLIDERGNIVEANDKALRVYGYPREELLKLGIADLRTPEAMADYENQWRMAGKQQGMVFETTHRHRDGSTFPVEVSARIISVPGKQLRQAIIRDISDRKQAEAAIIRARDFYLSLLDTFPNPVWRAGLDAKYDYFNQAWLECTGRELAQELGNGWVEGIHPDDLDRCVDTYLAAFQARLPFAMEFRLRNRDGSYHWVADHGKPLYDLNGEFMGYIGSCYDIQTIKTAEEHLEFLAHHDALTQLPNRMLLLDRIDQALVRARRDKRHVAILFIDLDRFKDINDTLGHAIGDQLLREVADRMRTTVRDADTVGRLGGDEFIIVIPDLHAAADVMPIAEKIFDTMASEFRLTDHVVHVTPSIGISTFPEHGQDAQTLVRNADAAMYLAKDKGRNTIHVYSQTADIHVTERGSLEQELGSALASGELALYYQPQIELASRTIVGMEALLRWQHPRRGLLQPGQFLAIAENNGTILAIGAWVLRTACGQCRTWVQNGLPAVPVCVNLSPLQFRQSELVDTVSVALRDSGLPPNLLQLGITEAMLTQTNGDAQARLKALLDLGVGLIIDDFDARHPKLGLFKRRAIGTLMLDRNQIRTITSDSDSASIMRSIIRISHQLNLKVIAEGVETQEQLALLSKEGCDAVQGFYFSEPLPEPRMTELLSGHTVMGPANAVRH